jgi:hypothetical protein
MALPDEEDTMAHTLRTLGRPVLGAIVAALGALATPAHGQWMLYRTDPYAVYPPYVDNVPRYTYVSPYHYSPGYTVPGHYEMISGQTPPVTMAVPRYSYNSSYHAAPGYTIPGHFAALPGPVVPQRVPVAPPRRKPVPPATEEPTPNSHYNAPVRSIRNVATAHTDIYSHCPGHHGARDANARARDDRRSHGDGERFDPKPGASHRSGSACYDATQ